MAVLLYPSPEILMAHSVVTTSLTDLSPASPLSNKSSESSSQIIQISPTDLRTLVILTSKANDPILRTIAEVTGKAWKTVNSLNDIGVDDHDVVGISAQSALEGFSRRSKDIVVINTHNVQDSLPPDPALTDLCDFEYLYQESPFLRRDLARFLSHVLGQTDFHERILEKERSNLISTTFPDVRAAIPNLDILTVGADVVEIRVDLLKEPLPDGSFNDIPSLKYVGEQVMLLRQRSEVPLIFTTRCTKENGQFPMDNPELFYTYLSRAIQWGVEYIDVELWLPEEIRFKLKEKKGHSKIISAFHDFSAELRWSSDRAFDLFEKAKDFGDIVKMNKHIKSRDENHELELFRSRVRSKYPHPPLSAVNMGQLGQWSRALNRVFSPVTHPLLPIIAAPGQLSAAEINGALHYMGNLPKREFYSIGATRNVGQLAFFKKCFNELGLPHNLSSIYQGAKTNIDTLISQKSFGGALLQPPISCTQSYLPLLSESARRIGQVDTVIGKDEGDQHQLIGDNTTWKAIRATLIRDFVPSAYFGRPALVLAQSAAEAAPAIYALRSLEVAMVYTVGFKASPALAERTERFVSLESMKRSQAPFVIICAMPAEKSALSYPLLKHYGGPNRMTSRIFLDLTTGPRKADHLSVAINSGWSVYDSTDIGAWTIVETLRSLVGHNASFDFVRMASGYGID